MAENKLIGMLFIGAAIGFYLPALPEPLTPINAYIGIMFLLIAVLLFIKG